MPVTFPGWPMAYMMSRDTYQGGNLPRKGPMRARCKSVSPSRAAPKAARGETKRPDENQTRPGQNQPPTPLLLTGPFLFFLPAFFPPLAPSPLISSEPPPAWRGHPARRGPPRRAPVTQEPPAVAHFSLDSGPSRPIRPFRPSRRQPPTLISAASGTAPGRVLDPQPAAERGSDNRHVDGEGPGFRAC